MANELRIRAHDLPTLVLTAEYDPSTDTEIYAAGLASYPLVDSTNHMAIVVDWDRATDEPFILYITAHSSGASVATVAKDQEGTTATTVPIGTECIHGPTPRDFVKAPVSAERTAGDVTLSSTSWGDVDTGIDLTLPSVYAGDIVEVTASIRWGGSSQEGFLDAVSVVSGSPVNSWAVQGAVSATSFGITAWNGLDTNGSSSGGGKSKQIVSGDLSGDTLTLRMRGRIRTAGSRAIAAGTDARLSWRAINYGPRYVAPTF